MRIPPGTPLGFRQNPGFTIPLKPGLFLKRYENIGLFNVRERKAVERSGLQPESLAGASPATDATLCRLSAIRERSPSR